MTYTVRICMVFVVAVLLLTGTARADGPKWFETPALDGAPDLSRGMGDPAWAKGLKIPFAKLNDGPGFTEKYSTESFWLYANGSLFIAFKCFNPDSPNLWAPGKQPRDNAVVFKHEILELFVGDMKGDLYYQFAIDTLGNLYDGKRGAAKWNGQQKHRVERHKGYWVVFFEIPQSVLSTIRRPRSFLTIDVCRTSYNADGSGKVVTAISPPGVHSPEDRMVLGGINPSRLGELQAEAIQNFRRDFKKAPLSKTVSASLKKLEAFAVECEKSSDISLAQYRGVYDRYIENGKRLTEIKRDIVLDIIFENGD